MAVEGPKRKSACLELKGDERVWGFRAFGGKKQNRCQHREKGGGKMGKGGVRPRGLLGYHIQSGFKLQKGPRRRAGP